ncbi:hypothetical protein SKAU_G00139010 [Synaphobranchus kaupii]|uniref:Uncharacterized protein n=1 Tax=Synaphobranchus kaupii TaxID=118154 RepID=A0A9Q1FSQ9_SYNKA|nr:hypothetical protein SKAU_G00139010 [Synaphobranchus kaupii]
MQKTTMGGGAGGRCGPRRGPGEEEEKKESRESERGIERVGRTVALFGRFGFCWVRGGGSRPWQNCGTGGGTIQYSAVPNRCAIICRKLASLLRHFGRGSQPGPTKWWRLHNANFQKNKRGGACHSNVQVPGCCREGSPCEPKGPDRSRPGILCLPALPGHSISAWHQSNRRRTWVHAEFNRSELTSIGPLCWRLELTGESGVSDNIGMNGGLVTTTGSEVPGRRLWLAAARESFLVASSPVELIEPRGLAACLQWSRRSFLKPGFNRSEKQSTPVYLTFPILFYLSSFSGPPQVFVFARIALNRTR